MRTLSYFLCHPLTVSGRLTESFSNRLIVQVLKTSTQRHCSDSSFSSSNLSTTIIKFLELRSWRVTTWNLGTGATTTRSTEHYISCYLNAPHRLLGRRIPSLNYPSIAFWSIPRSMLTNLVDRKIFQYQYPTPEL
jgi:hypothetical protein